MGQRMGNAGNGLMMICHNRLKISVADLLDHSAAKVREYNQIGSKICNLIQRTPVELPEE